MAENRVNKVMKISQEYLFHIQNSAFEGEITIAQLKELKLRLKNIINPVQDSVIFFEFKYLSKKLFKKEVIGLIKNTTSNII